MGTHGTQVFQCEDLLFTMLKFLEHDNLYLLQFIYKDLQYAIHQHFPQSQCPLKYYCCSLNLLSWAVEEGGCPLDLCRSKGMLYGAQLGSLEILQWLRAQDPPCAWSGVACQCAARGGHLAVLKWLRAQDPPCSWDRYTCRAAAEGGHLDG